MSRYFPDRTREVTLRKIYYRLKELHMLTTVDIWVSDSFSSNMLTLLLLDLTNEQFRVLGCKQRQLTLADLNRKGIY